jgi:hypothetical protein
VYLFYYPQWRADDLSIRSTCRNCVGMLSEGQQAAGDLHITSRKPVRPKPCRLVIHMVAEYLTIPSWKQILHVLVLASITILHNNLTQQQGERNHKENDNDGR